MRISKKIVLSLIAGVMAVSFAAILPVKEANALIKKSAAKSQCEDTWGGEFKPKKQQCINMTKGDGAKKWCEDRNVGGTWSKQDDGKFTCSWEGNGFADEDSYDETDTSKVYGEVKDDCPNGVKTSIIGGGGCYTDDGKGSGVYEILLIVLNILTAGVGVLGVVGLVISGVTYLTARDNEQQVAKAKQRILQIVIGLVIFAVLYVGLQWLIPGGIFGD